MPKKVSKTAGEKIESIAKVTTSVFGLGSAIVAFLSSTKNWFLDEPHLPVTLLWLSVVTFMSLGIMLIRPRTIAKPKPKLRWPTVPLIMLGLLLIFGAPIGGFIIHRKEFTLSPEKSQRVRTLKLEAKSQMTEDRVLAKELLEEAREIAPRDAEIKKLLDQLEPMKEH